MPKSPATQDDLDQFLRQLDVRLQRIERHTHNFSPPAPPGPAPAPPYVPPPSGCVQFADDFERPASATLGPNWQQPPWMFWGYDNLPMRIVTGTDVDGGTGAAMNIDRELCVAQWATATPGDQSIEVVVQPLDDCDVPYYGEVYLFAQMGDDARIGAEFWLDFDASGSSEIYISIYKFTSDGDSEWFGEEEGLIVTPDSAPVVLRLEALTTGEVRAYVNGDLAASATVPDVVGDFVGFATDMTGSETIVVPAPPVLVRDSWQGTNTAPGPFTGVQLGDEIIIAVFVAANAMPSVNGCTSIGDDGWATAASINFPAGHVSLWRRQAGAADVNGTASYLITAAGSYLWMATVIQGIRGTVVGSLFEGVFTTGLMPPGGPYYLIPAMTDTNTTPQGGIFVVVWGSTTPGTGTAGSGSATLLESGSLGAARWWLGVNPTIYNPTIPEWKVGYTPVQNCGNRALANMMRPAPATSYVEHLANRRVLSVNGGCMGS